MNIFPCGGFYADLTETREKRILLRILRPTAMHKIIVDKLNQSAYNTRCAAFRAESV